MTTNDYCKTILRGYPEYISADQMYRICHICKKTCRYLLENKLVPNIDSGKKTRRYRIKTLDVVHYLKDREINPEYYKPPKNYYLSDYKPKSKHPFGRPLNDDDFKAIRSFYEMVLCNTPDVMTVEQVSQVTGYCKNSVAKWCSKKHLKSFFIRQSYYVPKEYLLDFLLSSCFMGVAVKSTKHIGFNAEISAILACANKNAK